MFARGFRNHGYIPLTTYLRTYKLGDFVDIKVNGAIHKVRTSDKRQQTSQMRHGWAKRPPLRRKGIGEAGRAPRLTVRVAKH